MMKILVLILGGLGVLVALLVIYGAIYTWRLNGRYPPQGRFVDVPGARLHVVEQASGGAGPDGPTIVLLHGASATLRDPMLALGPALVAEGLSVVAFDRPGHGWSRRSDPDGHDPAVQARMIADALAALSIERPIVVGHSWSGSIVMAMLLNHRDAVAAGVTLGGATHPWPGDPVWYNRLALNPVIGPLFRWTLVPLVAPLLLPGGIVSNFAPNQPPPDYADDAGIAMFFRPHQFRANAADSVHLKQAVARMSERYGEIDAPLLVITGDQDATVSARRHSFAVAAQVPGARLVVLEGVGHMPHQVRTDDIVAEIVGLIPGVRSAAE